jgi:cell division protease FtsH
VRRLLSQAYDTAKKLLSDNVTLLHSLAERLIEKEVVDGAEVAEMVKAHQEGRPFVPQPTPAASSSANPSSPPRDKPRTVEEEVPATGPLHPKPSLA